jgi:hypothetical protein
VGSVLVAQACLELTVLLLLPPEFRVYRPQPVYEASVVEKPLAVLVLLRVTHLAEMMTSLKRLLVSGTVNGLTKPTPGHWLMSTARFLGVSF